MLTVTSRGPGAVVRRRPGRTSRTRGTALMVDYAAARTKMVDGQIRPNDVTDHRIITAMLAIPREAFVPASLKPLAYLDRDVVLAGGRAMLQPMVLAKMVQAAEIGASDVVLDVGCATGYSSALIARLASAVVAVEESTELANTAGDVLQTLGIDNVAVVEGALKDGLAAEGPYDVIIIEGAVEVFPDKIAAQLKDGGRLVVIEGLGGSARAMLYVRSGPDLSGRVIMNAAAHLLPGFAREPAFVF